MQRGGAQGAMGRTSNGKCPIISNNSINWVDLYLNIINCLFHVSSVSIYSKYLYFS